MKFGLRSYLLLFLSLCALLFTVEYGTKSGGGDGKILALSEPDLLPGETLFNATVSGPLERQKVSWDLRKPALPAARRKQSNDLGFVGQRVEFSGLVDGYLSLNPGGAGDSLSTSLSTSVQGSLKGGSRSIGAWIKTRSLAHSGILNYGNEKPWERFSLMSGDGVFFFSNLGDDFYGKAKIADDRWHLGVIVYDGKTARLFVDGVLDASKEVRVMTTSGGQLYVGSNHGTETFHGLISEPFVCNYALTETGITQLAQTEPHS